MKTSSRNPGKTILISAGEASGDLLGAALSQALRAQDPTLSLIGMGGPKMRDAGVDILVDYETIAIVGWQAIITQWREIKTAYDTLKRQLIAQPPDCLICIDYPGFNLRLAALAKRHGIRVFYYVSPQIWAWRYRRIFHMKRVVDHMGVLFKFEVDLYREHDIPVTHVGHPFVDLVKRTESSKTTKARFGLRADTRCIALLPGSRQQEIARLLPVMLAAAQRLQRDDPDIAFVLPLAPHITQHTLAPYQKELDALNLHCVRDIGHHYNVIAACDAAMVTSGSVTLEVALLNVPMVIVYRLSSLNYQLAKWVLQRSKIKLQHIGLCNIIAGKTIAQELIQDDVTPEKLYQSIHVLLNDTESNLKQNTGDHSSPNLSPHLNLNPSPGLNPNTSPCDNIAEIIHQQIGPKHAAERAAKHVSALLTN